MKLEDQKATAADKAGCRDVPAIRLLEGGIDG
jgi:hypothetical protein